ncbi:MAG: condensation domain-containing protein [Neomegalonema sp.]|nr:condensation domain-containing protein [Neomegalonema sp.]
MSTEATITPAAASASSIDPNELFPCTTFQRRCWEVQNQQPSGIHNVVGMRWRLLGEIDAATVEAALNALIIRHEILRTAIIEVDGAPMQHVLPEAPLTLAYQDLSTLPEEARFQEANAIGKREAHTPFDLERPPLLRSVLVKLDDRNHILHLTFHSAAVDGWSMGLLIREFGMIAGALQAGVQPDLPPVALQFADYALWQQDALRSAGFNEDRDYWRTKLAGVPRFEVTPDKPRPAMMAGAGEIRTLLLPADLNEKLVGFSRRTGQTLFQLASATLSATLREQTGQTDVVISAPSVSRDEVELESMVGSELNTLMLRIDASGDPSFDQLAERCGDVIAEAMDHAKLPFEEVVDLVGAPQDHSRTPLYSVQLVQQSAYIDTGKTGNMHFGRFEIISIPSYSSGAQTDLLFFMVGREEGWRISCEANVDLFEMATVDRMLRRWAQMIEAMIESDGAARIAAVPHRDIDRFKPGSVPDLSAATLAPAQPIATPKAAPSSTAPAAAAATSAEVDAKVIEIWRELLEKPEIHAGSDFFDNGGHSLTAMRMISRVNKAFSIKLKVAALFKAPTVTQFSAMILAERPDLATAAAPAAPAAAAPTPAPTPTAPSSLPPASAAPAAPVAAPGSLVVIPKLIEIWGEVLDRPGVSAQTDFFDAGGHSLSAMRMISRVNKNFGLKLKVAALFKAPSLSQFAGLILAERPELEPSAPAPAAAPVAPMSAPVAAPLAPTAAPTLTAPTIAPAGGEELTPVMALNNGSAFVLIQRRMTGNRQFIDIPVGDKEDAEFAQTHTLEESVARVVERIQKARPHGPYILLAYCGLSPIVVEAGRQLRAKGEHVQLIAVMDSFAPGYFVKLSRMGRFIRKATMVKRSFGYFGELARDYWSGKISLAFFLDSYGFIRKSGLVPYLAKLKLIEPLPEEDETLDSLTYFDAMLAAGYRNKVKPIETNLLSFCSASMYKGRFFPEVQGWKEVVKNGRVEEYRVPCEHREMTRDPFATLIGLHLDKTLLEIEAADAAKARAAGG